MEAIPLSLKAQACFPQTRKFCVLLEMTTAQGIGGAPSSHAAGGAGAGQPQAALVDPRKARPRSGLQAGALSNCQEFATVRGTSRIAACRCPVRRWRTETRGRRPSGV
jgi:hypothetical protein